MKVAVRFRNLTLSRVSLNSSVQTVFYRLDWTLQVGKYTPASLPSANAHAAMESTCVAVSTEASQFQRGTWPFTPMVPRFAFTPQRYAVAVHAESAICAFRQYVCNKHLVIRNLMSIKASKRYRKSIHWPQGFSGLSIIIFTSVGYSSLLES